MAGNSFGQLLRLTTFGESHGAAVGGILDGCPAGLPFDLDFIQGELNRRRPGQSDIVSLRNEKDELQIVSGIFEGKTTGAPIAFWVQNQDQHPDDYDEMKDVFRPSHAGFAYEQKYGIYDYRGGGRASARETLARVAGGAIAKLFLKQTDITISAYVSQIGTVKLEKSYGELDLSKTEESPVRCPDEAISSEMVDLITKLKNAGDTTGGIITCIIRHVPPGLGEPVFDKLQANLAKAMLSIPAAKGFEYGSGFAGVSMKGSEHNDPWAYKHGKITTSTNFSGGIQGGISNGEDIYFRVAFKPVATLMQPQEMINRQGEKMKINPKGRHDVCVAPRAVPVVEAMAALVIADHYLWAKIN